MNIAAIAAAFGGAAGVPSSFFAAPDRFWVSKKMRPTQFASNKNAPGKNYSKTEKAFEESVEENKELLGKLEDGPKKETILVIDDGVPPTAE